MTKTRSIRFSKRRRGGRKTLKRRGGKRRSRVTKRGGRRKSRVKRRSRGGRRSRVRRGGECDAACPHMCKPNGTCMSSPVQLPTEEGWIPPAV